MPPAHKPVSARAVTATVLGAVAVLLLLASVAVILWGEDGDRRSTYSATFTEDTFDTTLTVTVAASSSAEASTICEDIHEIVRTLHSRFDAYGDSELAFLNASAGSGEAIPLSEDLSALLVLGVSLHEATGGAVNIALGPVTALWHYARAEGDRLPDPTAIVTALRYTDISMLTLEGNTATLATGARIDVGAIAKGYAMKKVLDYARDKGLNSLLVNLGGHLLAVGNHPDGNPWRVSVPNPVTGAYETLELSNATVSTSGDYERTYTVDGKAYHHLIDPATGYPAENRRAATVILPLSHVAEADGYATALFLLPEADGEALIRAIPDARALWIYPDGTTVKTPNRT